MKICKLRKTKRREKAGSVWPYRLRGGADNEDSNHQSFAQSMKNLEESISPMVMKAIENAKFHGIQLHHGVQNQANGDCLFESVLDSINTRICFDESYEGTPAYWRDIWMSRTEDIGFDDWNLGGLSLEEWKAGFQKLRQSGTYELELGIWCQQE